MPIFLMIQFNIIFPPRRLRNHRFAKRFSIRSEGIPSLWHYFWIKGTPKCVVLHVSLLAFHCHNVVHPRLSVTVHLDLNVANTVHSGVHTPVVRKPCFKLRYQLQFKCGLQQNTFWNLTHTSTVNSRQSGSKYGKCCSQLNTHIKRYVILVCSDKTALLRPETSTNVWDE